MTWFAEGAVVGRSAAFRLERDGSGRISFIHESGRAVASDEVGAAVWDALPGTIAEIRERVGPRLDLSSRMLGDFLYLTAKAGVAVVEGEWAGNTGGKGREETLDRNEGLGRNGPARVSAVIVTYRGEDHIRGCLRSLRAQTLTPLDIHLVDNGASRCRGGISETSAIVRREFPEVAIHAPKKNLHYPGGINYGLARARGDFFLVLNDDVELDPGAVAEMARAMEKEPRAAAVVPMMKFFHLRGFINGIGNHVRPKGWGSDNFVGCVDVGQFDGLTEVPSAGASAVLLRRSAVEAVGPYDSAYRAFYEDADWSFRARLCGWTIAAAPRALVYHKFNASWDAERMGARLKLAARNRLRFVLKNFDGFKKRAFLRSYVKEDAKNTLALLRKRRFEAALGYVRAYGSLAGTFPGLYASRVRAKSAIRRSRAGGKGTSIAEILALNPAAWSCLNERNEPRLDAAVYYSYYGLVFRGMERERTEAAEGEGRG